MKIAAAPAPVAAASRAAPVSPLQYLVTRSTRGDPRSHHRAFRLPVQLVNKTKTIKRRRKMQLSE